MYPVSADFTDALARSHVIATRAEVWNSSGPLATLDLLDGSVTIDSRNAIRRSFTGTLVDPTGELTPTDASDLLAPFGNELRINRGIVIDGTAEYVPLGVFVLTGAQIVDERVGVHISVRGVDRAYKVSRARWTAPYAIASGTNYATAIEDLLDDRVSGLTFNFEATTTTTPALVFGIEANNDPWKDAQSMAASIGCELYFDADGICVCHELPDPDATAPVAEYHCEDELSQLLSVQRAITTETTYNHVIVTGEGANIATPVRGEAKDENPASPTYYAGPYGDVVYFMVSSFVTTQAQAEAAALAQLRRVIGQSEEVRFNAVVNPALDAFDVVSIHSDSVGLDANYVIDSLTIPLAPEGAMSAVLRKRQATA